VRKKFGVNGRSAAADHLARVWTATYGGLRESHLRAWEEQAQRAAREPEPERHGRPGVLGAELLQQVRHPGNKRPGCLHNACIPCRLFGVRIAFDVDRCWEVDKRSIPAELVIYE
jgi:hypothetical protein